MIHVYDVDVAKEVGVREAVILYNLDYWIEKNKANEMNFFDGRYWTFNSVRAFEVLFPEFSTRTIRTILDNLEAQGYLLVGNYNETTYDRTKWYALTDKYYTIKAEKSPHLSKLTNGFVKTDKWICQNRQMDLSELTNLYQI